MYSVHITQPRLFDGSRLITGRRAMTRSPGMLLLGPLIPQLLGRRALDDESREGRRGGPGFMMRWRCHSRSSKGKDGAGRETKTWESREELFITSHEADFIALWEIRLGPGVWASRPRHSHVTGPAAGRSWDAGSFHGNGRSLQ